MKKLILALILTLAMAVPAFAQITNQDITTYPGSRVDIGPQAQATATGGGATIQPGALQQQQGMLNNNERSTILSPSASATGIEVGGMFNKVLSPEANASANQAQGQTQGQNQMQGQNQGQSQFSNNTNLNTNLNANVNDNTNVNVNDNTNINKNDNKAIAVSESTSKSNALNANNQNINWNQTFEDARELPAALPIIPQVIPLIQGGRVGDVTGQVIKFAIAAKPYNGELVVKVLKIVNGSIFDRVRLEDIERDIFSSYKSLVGGDKWYEDPKGEKANGRKNLDPKKIRYLVQYKDSAMGAGMNVGGAGSASALNGSSSAYGGTGSVSAGFGYTRSTADPLYIIKWFQIE